MSKIGNNLIKLKIYILIIIIIMIICTGTVGASQYFKLPLPGEANWLVTQDSQSGHNALDFDNVIKDDNGNIKYLPENITPILAAASGTIIAAGGTSTNTYPACTQDGYIRGVRDNGYYVKIKHGDLTSIYLHLAYPPLVKKDDLIDQGEQIGIMGNTGCSSGSHLHFGINPYSTTNFNIENKNIDEYKYNEYYPSTNKPWQYAAFAYDPVMKKYSVEGSVSQESAQDYAEVKCRVQGGKNCQAVGWWRNGWGSFAVGPNNKRGWGTDPGTIENADRLALSFCGNDCQLVIRAGIAGSSPWVWGLRVSTNISNQFDPHIYRNLIVYRDSRYGNSDIFMYNITTRKERRITTNIASQYHPAIYGNRIVYYDNRNGNDDIYMYDLSTNRERRITTNTARQSRPSIYGNRIVWTDDRNGNSDIYMYDLSASTNPERRITTNTASQYNPSIYGNRIAYEDYRNGNGDIYMYDLSASTNPERRITTNTARQSNPYIYGNRIVYQDNRNGNVDIYMYDLSASTNREKRITTSPSRQSAYNPVIYGNHIVYESYRNNNLDIYMYII